MGPKASPQPVMPGRPSPAWGQQQDVQARRFGRPAIGCKPALGAVRETVSRIESAAVISSG